LRAMDGRYKGSAKMLAAKPTSVSLGNILLVVYTVFLFGGALGAYNIGSIPIQWLVNVGLITTVVLVALTDRLYVVPGSKPLLWLFVWGLFVTGFNILLNDYASLMPPLATTSYSIFVSLRFVQISAFISAIYLVYWLLARGYRDSIIKWTVIIGTLISIAAIYVYIAQVYGLPEPLRTRMATGGGLQQSTVFTYAFHRAMGTFREPSSLARWLVVPFFMSFIYRRSAFNLYAILIGGVLLLTGSMAGIMGVVSGLIGALFLATLCKFRNLKKIIRFVLPLGFAVLIFSLIVVPYTGGSQNLLQVIGSRVAPIMTKGMSASNQGYVYEYVENTPIPLFGRGFGNANILFGKYLGSELMGAFLSLYVQFLCSTGLVGLFLLSLFLLRPVGQVIASMRSSATRATDSSLFFMLAAYLSWLAMFVVRSEELPIMFAVVFALLAYDIHHYHRRKEGKLV